MTRIVVLVMLFFAGIVSGEAAAQQTPQFQPTLPPVAEKKSDAERVLANYSCQQVLNLLSTDLAAEELLLTEDQRVKIARIEADYRSREHAWSEQFLRVPEMELKAKQASGELTRAHDEMEEPTRRSLAALLDGPQLRRLDEITLQLAGPWFFDTEAGGVSPAEFNLSPEQLAAVAVVIERHQQASFEVWNGYAAGGVRVVTPETWKERNEFDRRCRVQFRESVTKLAAVLTPDQRRKFEQMRGRAFDFDRMDRERNAPVFAPSPSGVRESYGFMTTPATAAPATTAPYHSAPGMTAPNTTMPVAPSTLPAGAQILRPWVPAAAAPRQQPPFQQAAPTVFEVPAPGGPLPPNTVWVPDEDPVGPSMPLGRSTGGLRPVDLHPWGRRGPKPLPEGPIVDAEPGTYRVRLFEISSRRETSDDPDQWHSPFTLPGTELRFAIEAPNITQIAPEELKVDLLQTKWGREVKREKPGGFGPVRTGFDTQIDPGKRATFTVRADEPLLEQLDGLQIKGSIVIVVADGPETVKSDVIDFTQAAELELGGFSIDLWGEIPPGSRMLGTPLGLGNQAPPKHLGFQIAGDGGRLADVAVTVDGKPLSVAHVGSAGIHPGYEFVQEGNGKGRIELKVWKKLRAVRVPFEHGFSKAEK